MKLNILGTEYSVAMWAYKEKPEFEKLHCDGFCDSVQKEIAICDMKTHPGYEDETVEYCNKLEKLTLRHEIVHAFFNESGLQESSLQYSGGWAKNEEMVDWFAIQAPKLLKAFEEAGCL